jgi:heat shock protein HtpX
MLVADVMLRSTFFRRRGNSENSGGNALLIIGLVLAILSPLFAQLIKFAISRRREYLADSSSALLTRYPAGLAAALQKIAGVPQPLRTAAFCPRFCQPQSHTRAGSPLNCSPNAPINMG